MENLSFIALSIGLIVFGLFLVYGVQIISPPKQTIKNDEPIYYGPIRPTDNELYFRKNGITKELEITNE